MPRLIRSLLPAAATAALLSGPVTGQERYNTEDYRRVARALTCQCGGCNALVAECAMDRCPSSEPIRDEIAERLQAGDSPEAVIRMFADRYGLVVLAAPPASGFHLSAWILPVVFLLGGAVVVAFVVRGWRKGGPAVSPAPEAPPEVVARVERDVARIR